MTVASEGADSTVYEAGLSPDGSDATNDSETDAGSFVVSATDGIASVTVGGTIFTLAQLQAFSSDSPSSVIDTGEGSLVITGYSSSDGDQSATISYEYTLDEAQMHSDPGNDRVSDSVVVSVSGSGGSSANGTLTIDIVDDVPQPFYPQSGHVLLAVNSDAPTEQTVTQSLNFLSGADGLGDIVFNLDLVDGRQAFLNVDGDQLYLNNEPMFLQYTDAGDQGSIQAVTDSGDIGFTATIDAEGNVTYTIFSGSILTDAQITSVTDLSGIGGGNISFKGLNIGTTKSLDPDGTDDVLVTSEILPLSPIDTDQGTVNTTSTTLGVGQGAEISGGEIVRYDLVNNLSVDDTKNAESYSFAGYQETQAFSQKVAVDGSQKEASFYLRIYSMDLGGFESDRKSSLVSGPGGQGQLILTHEEVKIYDKEGVVQQLTEAGEPIVTTNSDGSVLVKGLQDGWTFQIVSVDDNLDPETFNAVEIQGVEISEDDAVTTSFKLGEFSYGEEPSFSPVTFELPVTGSDADGDSLDGQVAITVYPDSESIVGDAQGNDLSGTSADDSLFGLEGGDTLTGGKGDDVLAGGLGADTFAWSFADIGGDQGAAGSPAVDLVTDFNLNEVSEGDVLQLNDLLPETGGDVGSYIHAVEDGEGNTLLHISSNGAFDDGFDANNADQIIALNGVSMEGADSTAFIQSLIAEGQLDIE